MIRLVAAQRAGRPLTAAAAHPTEPWLALADALGAVQVRDRKMIS
jgi:hypothetical protein